MEFIQGGATAIQAMIDAAYADGSRAVTVTGNYEIEKTIRIPSNFSLLLMNCHLRMAAGTFCNMFVNASHGTEKGRTREGADHNIIIEGIGRVILDGGEYNGLSERNHSRDGMPHISVNNILLFTNVEGFTIRNIHVRNQRWWALNFISCCRGVIQNIDFCADDSWIDSDGTIHHGFGKPSDSGENGGFCWQKIRIRNADGIDLRAGCHDIMVENITGFTQDDTVAVTGLRGELERMYCVENADDDIYNISIRNVMVSAFCAKVRLLNQSGVRMYNILVDGVFDTSKGNPHMQSGGSGVRLGDNHMYGTRHATEDETKNITVQNVHSRAEFALRLAGNMSACCFRNISHFDDPALCVDDQANVDTTSFFQA